MVLNVTLFMYLGDVQVGDITARNERLFNQCCSMQVTCVGRQQGCQGCLADSANLAWQLDGIQLPVNLEASVHECTALKQRLQVVDVVFPGPFLQSPAMQV